LIVACAVALAVPPLGASSRHSRSARRAARCSSAACSPERSDTRLLKIQQMHRPYGWLQHDCRWCLCQPDPALLFMHVSGTFA
jgi:hypothetical protein